MTKQKLTRKELDSPERWKVWDAWHDAVIFAAMNDYFNLREDGKVAVAFFDNKLDIVKRATKTRLSKVGATKPIFKKQKKLGLDAQDEKGTRAYAGHLYEHKLMGSPKPLPKPRKAQKRPKVKKVPPLKKAERKPLSPPNPNLSQSKALAEARKLQKKGEVLSYIHFSREDKKARYFVAVYRNKAKKKIEREVAIAKPAPVKAKKKKIAKKVVKRV